MDDEKLKNKYKELIKDISFEDLQEKIKNKELDINSPVSKIWAIHYMPEKSENQIETFVDFLIETGIVKMVIINPYKIFEKVFRLNFNEDTGFEDSVIIFKDNIVQEQMLNILYPDAEDLNFFSLKNYIDVRNESLSEEKEKYDPLKFEETQKEIDRLMEKIQEKMDNNDPGLNKEEAAKIFLSGSFTINQLKKLVGEPIEEDNEEEE